MPPSVAPPTIGDALDRATAGAHRGYEESVRAAASALLMPLGIAGVHDRVTLRVSGDRPDVVHELLVDGRPAWRGAMERGRWSSTWLVAPDSLS